MGRNYIAARTWADPREGAAPKTPQRERDRKKRAAEALADKAVRKRLSVYWIKGCGKPTSPDWMGRCGEQCHLARLKELDRREEVKQARRPGIPVAEYRKQIQN